MKKGTTTKTNSIQEGNTRRIKQPQVNANSNKYLMNIFGVKNMKNGNLGPVSREKMQLKKFQVEEY